MVLFLTNESLQVQSQNWGWKCRLACLTVSQGALSVAQLVALGARFEWGPSGALLEQVSKRLELVIQQGVTLIALPAVGGLDSSKQLSPLHVLHIS